MFRLWSSTHKSPLPVESQGPHLTQCAIRPHKCICQMICKSIKRSKHSTQMWHKTDHVSKKWVAIDEIVCARLTSLNNSHTEATKGSVAQLPSSAWWQWRFPCIGLVCIGLSLSLSLLLGLLLVITHHAILHGRRTLHMFYHIIPTAHSNTNTDIMKMTWVYGRSPANREKTQNTRKMANHTSF